MKKSQIKYIWWDSGWQQNKSRWKFSLKLDDVKWMYEWKNKADWNQWTVTGKLYGVTC